MRPVSYFLIISVVSLSIFVGCAGGGQEFTPPAEYETGLAAIEEYRFAEAKSVFDVMVPDTALSAWGYCGLGETELGRMNYLASARYFYQALEKDRQFAPAYVGLGRVASRLNWPEMAVDMFERGIDLGGNYDHARTDLARAQLKIYAFDQARATANLMANPINAEWINAIAGWNAQEVTPVSGLVAEAVSASDSVAELIGAAEFFNLAGMPDSASTYSYRMAELSDWGCSATQEFLKQVLAQGDFLAARYGLSKIPRTPETKSLIARLMIDYHLAREERVEAFLYNRQYQEDRERDLDGQVVNYIVKVRMADAFTAERMLVEIETYLINQQHPVGFERFLRLYTIGLHPEVRAGHQAYTRLAKQKIENSRELPFDLLELYIALGAGVFDEYDSLESAYFDNWGEGPSWMTLVADINAREAASSVDRALKLYPTALEKSETFYPAFEGWVKTLVRERRFDEAVSAFETYSHFIHYSPRLTAMNAICLAETNRADSAWKLFEPAMKDISVASHLIDRFLQALWKFDQSGIGRMVVDRWVKLQPDSPEALAMAAEWAIEFGELEQGLNLAERAEKLPLETRSAEIQKARALYLSGEIQKGTNLFVALLDSTEADPELSLYYSGLLAKNKKNPRQASNMAREALVKSRHTIKAMMNICYVYSQQRRNDLAIGQARQAIRQYPDHPKLFYVMGKAARAENRDEYKGALEQAIKLGLSGELLIDARKILGK